jgi:hypothetical protein
MDFFLFQTNDALVAPLLRLKDNNCHIEESEKILRKKEKFSELIILYEKKGLHEKGKFICRKVISSGHRSNQSHKKILK